MTTSDGRPVQGGSALPVYVTNEDAIPVQAEVDNGTAITGQALESGGAGLLGWLSSLRKAIADRLPSALSSDRLKAEIGDSGGAAVTATADPASNARALAVRQAPGEAHLGEVGGRTRVISTTLTRPADTTQYAANDAVTNSTSAPAVITFDGCARIANGSGVIVGVTMVDSANGSTAGSFELWLFDTTYTPNNDNAAFAPADAELAALVGIVPLTTSYVGNATSGAGGNRVYIASNLNIPFQCTGGTDDLYGAIVVRNAYTPVSAEAFVCRLRILQD